MVISCGRSICRFNQYIQHLSSMTASQLTCSLPVSLPNPSLPCNSKSCSHHRSCPPWSKCVRNYPSLLSSSLLTSVSARQLWLVVGIWHSCLLSLWVQLLVFCPPAHVVTQGHTSPCIDLQLSACAWLSCLLDLGIYLEVIFLTVPSWFLIDLLVKVECEKVQCHYLP